MYESRSHIAEGVYSKLLEIDHYAHREYVQLYDKNLFSVNQLPVEKRIVLRFRYLTSLFELCEYKALIAKVDRTIEDLIYYNILEVEDENAYEKLLFLKAASLYNTGGLIEAEYILSQLIRMHPKNELYKTAFIKNKILQSKSTLIKTRAIAVLVFLLSALITAIQLLVISPYMPEYNAHMDIGRYSMFSMGLMVLIFPEVIIRMKVNGIVNKI